MASSEAQKFADLLRSGPKMAELPLPEQRAAGEHAEDLTAEPEGVEWTAVDHGAVRGQWAVAADADAHRVVLYCFGGGHVITSVAARRKFAGHLSRFALARVFAVDYPLAPEHPYPADVDAVAAAYRWLLEEGVAPGSVTLAGESSAGGLVMSALLQLRSDGHQLPAGAYLMSPWVDLTCSGRSFEANIDADLEATRPSLLRMAGQYLGGHDPTDPGVNALFADLRSLSPLLVQVGGDEILLDDSVSLARRAGLAQVDVRLEIWPEMQHFFQLGVGVYPEAAEALTVAGRWLMERTSPAATG
jgi:epsilon-lactone hydrolase